MYEVQKNNLSLALNTTENKNNKILIERLGKDLNIELSRYENEKREIQARAIQFDRLYTLTSQRILTLNIAFIFVTLSLLGNILAAIISLKNKPVRVFNLFNLITGVLILIAGLFL